MPTKLQMLIAYLQGWFSYYAPKKTTEPSVGSPEVVSHVTGEVVTYYVPGNMKKIKVRLLAENGAYKQEYTLTDFIGIKPGERIQIRVVK